MRLVVLLLIILAALITACDEPTVRYDVLCLSDAGDTLFASPRVQYYREPSSHFIRGHETWTFGEAGKWDRRWGEWREMTETKVTGNCVVRPNGGGRR